MDRQSSRTNECRASDSTNTYVKTGLRTNKCRASDPTFKCKHRYVKMGLRTNECRASDPTNTHT